MTVYGLVLLVQLRGDTSLKKLGNFGHYQKSWGGGPAMSKVLSKKKDYTKNALFLSS